MTIGQWASFSNISFWSIEEIKKKPSAFEKINMTTHMDNRKIKLIFNNTDRYKCWNVAAQGRGRGKPDFSDLDQF